MRGRNQSRADAENKAEEFVAKDVEFGVHGQQSGLDHWLQLRRPWQRDEGWHP